MPATYPTEFKNAIMRRYQGGETLKSLSEEFHISQSTLYHWRKMFCSIEAPQHTYTPKDFDAISRKLEKLEHEAVSALAKSELRPLCRNLICTAFVQMRKSNSRSVSNIENKIF